MNDINSYIIVNKKTNLITELFIKISILTLASLIVICGFKYKKYYQTAGQVIREKNNYQLAIYLYPYQLNIIKNNNVLIIENLEYKYSIDYIADEYIISSNSENYLKVILNINLKEKDKIVNNILQIKVLESNKKVFYYLKDYLKKEEE